MTGTLSPTGAFTEAEPFRLLREMRNDPSPCLFTASEATPLEAMLLERLEALPPSGLLAVNFEGVRVASEAARQLLRRALRRLVGGELEDRYLVLCRLGPNLYNIDVMLRREGLVAVERADPAARVMGEVDPATLETYAFLASQRTATAKSVQDKFGLQNISAATNRLTALSRLALARRVDQRPVPGGGREYIYAAVR